MADLAVIIVSHNSVGSLRACLGSGCAHAGGASRDRLLGAVYIARDSVRRRARDTGARVATPTRLGLAASPFEPRLAR